jgi:hypothetical protein
MGLLLLARRLRRKMAETRREGGMKGWTDITVYIGYSA